MGTIFQLTPNGSFNVLYQFCPGMQNPCPEGDNPESRLTQLTDGSFYGGTFNGGISTPACGGATCGTLFRLLTELTPFVRPNPEFGKIGQTINILGSNLTGATSVTFNGVSANFEVFSATNIRAQVPVSATSGMIQVTTTGGTLSSSAAFQVLP